MLLNHSQVLSESSIATCAGRAEGYYADHASNCNKWAAKALSYYVIMISSLSWVPNKKMKHLGC